MLSHARRQQMSEVLTWAAWLPHIGRQCCLCSHCRQLAGLLKLLCRRWHRNMLPQCQNVFALAAAEVLGGTQKACSVL